MKHCNLIENQVMDIWLVARLVGLQYVSGEGFIPLPEHF
jgi:hypothetical protein